MAKVLVAVEYDPKRLLAADITDTLNELLHGLAEDRDLDPDANTGGYKQLDWEYRDENGDYVK